MLSHSLRGSSSETSIIFDDEAKTALHSIKTSTHKDTIKKSLS